MGGTGARNGCLFLSFHVKNAPIRVARLPKMTSGTAAPPKRLANKHPIKSPGTAAGVKAGRIVNASETRTCISRNENGAKTIVRTTYRAAINAACAMKATFLFCIFIFTP